MGLGTSSGLDGVSDRTVPIASGAAARAGREAVLSFQMDMTWAYRRGWTSRLALNRRGRNQSVAAPGQASPVSSRVRVSPENHRYFVGDASVGSNRPSIAVHPASAKMVVAVR